MTTDQKPASSIQHTVTIVSGLPRSGTSLIMQMLQAGGMTILSDQIRKPDINNPRGYYEFEPVKRLKSSQDWLEDAKGKAVKVISELLQYLPPVHDYRVIFVERNMDELLASQRKMLGTKKKPVDQANELKIREAFEKHLLHIKEWLNKQSNMTILYVNYNDIIKNTIINIQKINKLFNDKLNGSAMVAVIDENLYRNRK